MDNQIWQVIIGFLVLIVWLYYFVVFYRVEFKLLFFFCCICVMYCIICCFYFLEEWVFIGIWIILEFIKVIEKGYQVFKIFEVWYFENKLKDLFKKFIYIFMKMKEEVLGWFLDVCIEEEKVRYVVEYEVEYGIRLDFFKIEMNFGRCLLVKLMFNFFWGKFG